MMKLSKRLSTICSFVPPGVTLADIGSDHGQLVMALSMRGDCRALFASDNKIGPYGRLKTSILQTRGLITPITTYLASGLEHLPVEVDCIVIAGMGGDLIASILQEGKDVLAKRHPLLILQANTLVPLLRRSLNALGYSLTNEKVVEDGHYYEILVAAFGKEIYDEDDYDFGPLLRREQSEEFVQFYQNRMEEIHRLFTKDLSTIRKEELKKEEERIRRILHEN